MTFIGSGKPGFDEANSPGIFLRRGSRGSFNNIVVTNFYSPLCDISDANTQAQADAGNLTMNGILCGTTTRATSGANTLEGQITGAYTLAFATGPEGSGSDGQPAGQNFVVMDPMLAVRSSTAILISRVCFGSPFSAPGLFRLPTTVLRSERQLHRRHR